jgi:hypothetical protein
MTSRARSGSTTSDPLAARSEAFSALAGTQEATPTLPYRRILDELGMQRSNTS